MSTGIEVSAGNHGIFSYPVVWHEPGKDGATFIVIKDDAIGLASENYVAELIAEIWAGDLPQADAWDHLLIKTSDMEFPVPCFIEAGEVDGETVAVFRSGSKAGFIRFTMKI